MQRGHGLSVHAEEDRKSASEVCLLVRSEQERMTQVRRVQTATATQESGRHVSWRVPWYPTGPKHVSGHLYTSISPDIEARVLPC